MNCPKCGKAMREGYLFTSKDGAFSFANTVPGVFENAKKRRRLCGDHAVKAEPPRADTGEYLRRLPHGSF